MVVSLQNYFDILASYDGLLLWFRGAKGLKGKNGFVDIWSGNQALELPPFNQVLKVESKDNR